MPTMLTPSRRIEIWYDFASNYSYLSVMRIEEAAAQRAVSIMWRPFLLGPIFKSFGWDNSPFVLQKEKGAYMWNDMVRECQKYRIPWHKPTAFPRLSVLPARVALIGADAPWIGDFSRAVMKRNFAEDGDIHTEEAMRDILEQLRLDTNQILQAARSTENKERLRAQTELAKAKGIFGAPTFFVEGEMYWGNDRLDDALARASNSSP